MFDTSAKIKMVMDGNRSKVKNLNDTDLVNFLWEHDCVRDRVMTKLDILHFLKR